MNALAPASLAKLAKVCALFSSNHIGERGAAAAKADQLVKAAGLTWPDVLTPQRPAGGTFKTSRRRVVLPTAGEILARHGECLTDWERRFLATIIRRPSLSPRQREIFTDIQARFAR